MFVIHLVYVVRIPFVTVLFVGCNCLEVVSIRLRLAFDLLFLVCDPLLVFLNQVQYLSNIFWRWWSKEYLPQLQIRQKWLRKRRDLTVGDVVLVSANNSPRNTWPLGRVLKVHSDKKGIVRRVTVKTKSGILERPVDKLCLLLETEDSLRRTYTYLVLSVIVEPFLRTLSLLSILF